MALVGVAKEPFKKSNRTKNKTNGVWSHSKVNVALTLLAVLAVLPPLSAQAEESKATTSKNAPQVKKVNIKDYDPSKVQKAISELDWSKIDIEAAKKRAREDVEGTNPSKASSKAPAKSPSKNSSTSSKKKDAIGDALERGEKVILKTPDGKQMVELSYDDDEYSEDEVLQSADLSQNEAIRHFEAARFYMSKWDTELAEVELRAAIMYMPEMKVAHRDYCLVALSRGKPLRALAEFMMVVGLGEPIPLSEMQQTDLREEAAGLHYNKGLKFAEKSQWKDAINELLWSRKYTPQDPAIYRSLAFAYASNNQFDKAQEQYNYTLQLNPHDALAHADYAILLSEKGHVANAVEQMKKAVKAKPDAAALHVDLGYMAESKGDLKLAAAQFQHAAQLQPEHATLWAHLGEILRRQGEEEQARKAFQKALKLDKNNDEAKDGIAKLKPPESTSDTVSGDSKASTSDLLNKDNKDKDTSDSTTKVTKDGRKYTPLKRK